METIKLKDETGTEYEVNVSKLRPVAEEPEVIRIADPAEEGRWEVQIMKSGGLYSIGVMGTCDHEELGELTYEQERTAMYIGEDEVIALRDALVKICATEGWD